MAEFGSFALILGLLLSFYALFAGMLALWQQSKDRKSVV